MRDCPVHGSKITTLLRSCVSSKRHRYIRRAQFWLYPPRACLAGTAISASGVWVPERLARASPIHCCGIGLVHSTGPPLSPNGALNTRLPDPSFRRISQGLSADDRSACCHPLRAIAHRKPAYRGRSHCTVQLALCTPCRRILPASHRGH